MSDRALLWVLLGLTVVNTVILVRAAQVGLDVSRQVDNVTGAARGIREGLGL